MAKTSLLVAALALGAGQAVAATASTAQPAPSTPAPAQPAPAVAAPAPAQPAPAVAQPAPVPAQPAPAVAAPAQPAPAVAQPAPVPAQPTPAPAQTAPAPALPPAVPAEAGPGLTMEQAVAIALQKNRDVIAAKMDIEAAQLDVVAARLYPNPNVQVGVGNLVLGKANDQMGALGSQPGFFGQPVVSAGVSEIIDVWSKRGARIRAADRGVEQRRYLTEDALREVVYAVRSAFADAVRAESERDMALEVAARYADTVRLSQSRFRVGEIAEAELRKIELEQLRYQNAVLDSELQVDVARRHLAALLGMGPDERLPGGKLVEPDTRPTFDARQLTAEALERRPDLRAAMLGRSAAEARLTSAERDAYPDLTLGATYTHSAFTISGDNPDSMGLNLSLPLPLFDRNQANIGRARLDIRHAENDTLRLQLAVENDVAQAVRKADRLRAQLAIFETSASGLSASATADTGGMLARAETALRVAEKSYKAGAISLLELLEAQRTYLDTRADYLHARQDFRQAAIDVAHAVGE